MIPDVFVSVRFNEVSVFKNVAHYVVNNGTYEVDGCSFGLGGRGWVDAIGLHEEGLCGGNVAVSGVFVNRFEVNQWHEGFGDRGVDEEYVGRVVLGVSLAMEYRVGRGLSRGSVILNDGDRCGMIVIGRSGHVVLLCGRMMR